MRINFSSLTHRSLRSAQGHAVPDHQAVVIAYFRYQLYFQIFSLLKIHPNSFSFHSYHNGDEVDDYSGDRSLKDFSQYIESFANKYKPAGKVVDRVDPAAAAVHAMAPAEEEQREIPNPNGIVVALTAESFRSEVFNRPDRHWFVDMYAPWCQHCKKLAPVWDRLASELKGKVNVGKVDCTVYKGEFERNTCIGKRRVQLLQV